jgi:hypothetical protein
MIGRLVLLVALAVTLTGTAIAATTGAPTQVGWSLEAQFSHVTLDSISCQSASSCTAVGSVDRSATAGLGNAASTQITNTHGVPAWHTRLITAPRGAVDSALNGVSCLKGLCRAVGAYTHFVRGQLIIRSLAVVSRNGGRWRAVEHPAPDVNAHFPSSVLVDISCPTVRFCVAVGHIGAIDFGYYPVVLVYHGQKGRWQHVPLFPGKVFQHRTLSYGGVSCSAAYACMVVGTYNPPGAAKSQVFSTRFRQHWRIVRISTPARYDVSVGGVSCVDPTHCVVVGQYGHPGPEYPFLVRSHPFVRTYKGAWGPLHGLPVPAGATGAVLTDVKCPKLGSCVAVGAATRYGVPIAPLSYRLAHGAWIMQHPPTSDPSKHPYLNAVSCPTLSSCVAVGVYDSDSGSFIERLG